MIKLLFILGVTATSILFTHEYKTRKVGDNTEGILFTECLHEPNDTVKITPTVSVIIIEEIQK